MALTTRPSREKTTHETRPRYDDFRTRFGNTESFVFARIFFVLQRNTVESVSEGPVSTIGRARFVCGPRKTIGFG